MLVRLVFITPHVVPPDDTTQFELLTSTVIPEMLVKIHPTGAGVGVGTVVVGGGVGVGVGIGAAHAVTLMYAVLFSQSKPYVFDALR